MSRIGRKSIPVPDKVKIAIKGQTVSVTGPLGTLEMTHKPEIQVKWTESEKAVHVTIDEAKHEGDRFVSALWGTTRALINTMIIGVTKGYEEVMEVNGVGWTASLQGPKLKLILGYANPIFMDIPKNMKVVVDKQLVRISGPDKQAVGQFASEMRSHRKPEPYNGKGVKYQTEVIKKKAGKAFGTA